MIDVKGITLTTLVITIVVLLILAGVATYTGIEAIDNTKRTKFIAELKIMQSYVNEWYEDCKPNNVENWNDNIAAKFENTDAIWLGTSNNGTVDKAKITLTAAGITISANNFYYLSSNTLNSFGVEGVSQDVLVSIQDRKVVSYAGLKYKNSMYYTIDNLDSENGIDAIYNVGYTNPNSGTASFELSSRYIGNGKTKIEVRNISFDGYNNKWYVKYKKQGDTNWEKQAGADFDVFEDGTYQVQIENENINSEEKTIKIQMDPQVGEFVAYNVEYTDMYSDTDLETSGEQHYTFTQNDGWRILDPGTKNSDGSYKNVKIISTGIPAILNYNYGTKTITTSNSWWGTKEQVAELFDTDTIKYSEKGYEYKSNSSESGYPNAYACAGMYKNFLDIPLSQTLTPSYNTGGYIMINNNDAENNNICSVFKNSQVLEAHILSRTELETYFEKIYNKTYYNGIANDDTLGMFYLNKLNKYGYTNDSNTKYWLSTPSLGSGANVFYINNDGTISIHYLDNYGIRPVITLKSNIYKDNNVWKIK